MPAAPTGLTAAGSAGQIALSWTGSAGAESYQVERSSDGVTGWAQVGTVAAPTTAYTDAGLPAGVTFSYRVRASGAAGDSGDSNVAIASTASSQGLPFSDDFGGASLGSAWSTAGGTWSQSGGVLRQTDLAAGDPKKALAAGIATPADVEVHARVRVDTWAGGDMARAGVSLGNDGAGRGYNLLFHRDTGTVQFLHDHVAWGNRYDFSWQVGVWYHFALRQEGGVLLGKVWADGQAEPEGWMFRQEGWASRAGRRGSTAAPTPAPPPASTTSR